MTARALLTRASAKGVELAVAEGKLRMKGAASPALLAELREHKADIIALLSAPSITPASIADWRAKAEAVAAADTAWRMLKDVTLAFLDTAEAEEAARLGWDAVSLFGVHAGSAPRQRVDCWGLAVHLAWSVFHLEISGLREDACTLKTGSGAAQTLRRHHPNHADALPWWRHAALSNHD
ncbi:hypothetical protein T281_16740 [Rhodomicrobium udaipurense JA643]|uniref:TubC N-terminal docking domain-containing protein n=1 Tax=Rhodomicrobium udaipurense TaxID=1202716 RepID=A0A8I1KMD8_9HYPH|nr:hypothetical protein [Rhodomicrobium udaipurense]KAI93430.1 hypothetical protein T281_16740 [Rhodomicrobium udaipurense JA643]MBJ7545173.1 hypothetical protein [Rhodomicrobium udaipurense]